MADSDGGRTKPVVGEAARYQIQTRQIRVKVVAGPDAGLEVVLAGPSATVGSGRDRDLALTDPTASAAHLTLRVSERGVRVTDTNSRNGTRVDGLDALDVYARPDSSIVIGRTTMRLRLLPDSVSVPTSNRERFGGVIGKSVVMRQLFGVLERIAPTDSSILLEGETGTGKDIVAESIHEQSHRAEGPFVVFDCSAASENLIESALFGHVKGAFTGAQNDRPGAFVSAHGGTLFIDEVGELPIHLQPKLLRALESRTIVPVGSNETRPVDVRIIAATNRVLANEIEGGRFRQDLYYRLAVVRLTNPALRERPEDLPMLVEHFVRQIDPAASPIDAATVAHWQAMAWPGNVRELRNAVARTLSIGPATTHTAAPPPDLGRQVDLSRPLKEARDRVVDAFELAYLRRALERSGGNVSRAAATAGVNRKFIYRTFRRLGLDPKDVVG